MNEVYTNVLALLNETVVTINGMDVGNDRVEFVTKSGRQFIMYHEQDCCESVLINEIIGDPNDLLNAPLTMAEETSNSDSNLEEYESCTWTFYNFATINGYVTLRWLGMSNGYYSEAVSFYEMINSELEN